jgi:hypothetical protein
MSIPLRIHGPAIVQFNGVSYYFKTGLKVAVKSRAVNIDTDAFGVIAKAKADIVVELTGTPVGQIDSTSLTGQWPYVPANIGASVFGASDVPLIVQTINDGQQITWSRGAITKYPSVLLSATKGTIYKGDITFSCLQASSFTPTSTTAWKSIASEAFADTTFAGSKVRMAQYVAAWGSSSPYSAMLAQEGFELTPAIKCENIVDDNFGVIDMVLKSMEGSVKFKPSSLTEAQIDTLIELQGSSAMLQGAVPADTGHNLVITSSLLVATLVQAGAVDYDLMYATGKLRAGEVMFNNVMTFTSGAPNAIFTFAIPG